MTAKPAAARATVYGYPRQGQNRELKKAIEGYWKGRVDADALRQTAAELRRGTWQQLAEAGVHEVPTGDFSYYDHVLDTSVMVGAVPERHRDAVRADALDGYFAMARGTQDVAPLEMTKWFDTNYHYLVPELGPDTVFTADSAKQVAEFKEALALGHTPRPVLVGPVTYLLLAKAAPGVAADFEPLTLLDRLLPVYAEVLADLRAAGAEWVQLDEPALVQDRTPAELNAAARAYRDLGGLTDRPKLLVASYFGRLGEALAALAKAPVDGLALDFTEAGAGNLDDLAAAGGLPGKRLVAGVVNGRNIWINDYEKSLATLGTLLGLADRVDVSASCSLLHVPLDAKAERDIDPQIARWLAFAQQKTEEIVVLARGLASGTDAIAAELAANRADLASRTDAAITRDPAVRARTAAITDADGRRSQPYAERTLAQRAHLGLPLLPTTTIGSFPQTTELRTARADLRAGRIDEAGYEERIKDEIREVLSFQEKAGIDVLVHGEPERNDMVQYFAEQLTGYLATQHGWVQSYGTRYVRPPVLAGDISRPEPMTVRWTAYAQSLTDRPVKGMLTGPVTMLAWSFVRDDQPLGDTARQVALALRDEVNDLEANGTSVIQVDEPALRETLPLRAADHAAYLQWATESFRLATAGVRPDTQIHTHMCYAEFGDIIQAIDDLDADVISLEAARSHMQVARDLAAHGYPREAGPGVYDIHSPRIPSTEEAAALLRKGLEAIPAKRLWVNPDCGLKTRGWPETRASLENLVAAAREIRAELPTEAAHRAAPVRTRACPSPLIACRFRIEDHERDGYVREVTCHEVDARRLDGAAEGIVGRTAGRWHRMRYDDPAPRRMRELAEELLDHVAARTSQGAALDDVARSALSTAAECRLGEMSVGCFPEGDQEILFPLIGENLSTEDISFGDVVASSREQAPSARTWLDLFAACLVSGLVWDWERVTGLLLRSDYAPAIHQGVPYSTLASASTPADLAAMDALCRYLTEADGHQPRHWPTVPLRKPDADERAEAAAALDAVDAPTSDQQLLRVLLDDQQDAFEQGLVERLDAYRESVGPDPAPRTLLPLDTLTLAALAVQVHGWELGVRSGYLPAELLGSPDALRRAVESGSDNSGPW